MFLLILVHVVTGLAGIASGFIVVGGMLYGKRWVWWDGIFLSTTCAACATGFVFLPAAGVTSAQLVAFFISFLLAVAAYVRLVRGLEGPWKQIYAFAVVGALFLDVLITIAQSFLHVRALRALAPTQQSGVYVAVKFTLLLLFIGIALMAAKRAGRS